MAVSARKADLMMMRTPLTLSLYQRSLLATAHQSQS